MTDYLFSNMPNLFDEIEDETWFRLEKLFNHKSYDLKLNISVYRSGRYFIVIKCLNINRENHIVASILLRHHSAFKGRNVDFSEHKIYFDTKTLEDSEQLLMDRLLVVKLSSLWKTIWNIEKNIIKFDDKVIMYSPKNSFIPVRA